MCAQIFMPDFFGEGKAFRMDQDKKEAQAFLKGTANPPASATRLLDFANLLKGEGFKKIGALGYCWGNV